MSAEFARLIDLAREPSSEKRRELLREITDMFFVSGPKGRTASEAALFDTILRDVAKSMQDSVLRELAERFAENPDAPIGLMRDLANKAFNIAEPVLRRSTVLGDADLVSIVDRHGEDHIRAIAGRSSVSELVSSAIVQRGNDETVRTLVANAGARFDRSAYEAVFERARNHEDLTRQVVQRSDAPLDLLNEIVLAVSTELRNQILARNANVNPEELDLALEKARARMKERQATVSPSYAQAEIDIRGLASRGQLNARMLVSYYRENLMGHFLVGLAHMTEVDVAVAESVVARGDMDALAMMCRAAEIERPLFVTIAVLACGGQRAMGRAEEFGAIYAHVPVEAAQRAMRFYRLRRGNTEGVVAA